MTKNKTFMLLAVVFIAGLVSCKSNDLKPKDALKSAFDTTNFTTVKWVDSLKNFGTIKNGEKIKLEFKCINTGNKPLIITSARPGCGCTIADYTHSPIAPGQEGVVTASFNSKNFSGTVHKSMIVNTNTKNGTEHILYFTGNIEGGPGTEKIMVPHTDVRSEKRN